MLREKPYCRNGSSALGSTRTGETFDFQLTILYRSLPRGTPVRFLKDRDLACVIELMLQHAVQHERNVVALARDAISESLLGQCRDRSNQIRMRPLQQRDCRAPCRLPASATALGSWGEVLLPCGLRRLAPDSTTNRSIPYRRMQH